ncbi:MAG TPA: transporter substrate-binding domain-containing protein [Ignavibacteriales bacterium]|nr:transporter substrate-binding domain-containing protein [Ignavibacteriales bacterium]
MAKFRSGFSGAVLRFSLYSLVFLLLLSAPIAPKDRSKTKNLPKISLEKKTLKRKPLHKTAVKDKKAVKKIVSKVSSKNKSSKSASSKKNTLLKAPVRKITVVMESHPPFCYIENPPKLVTESEFKNSILKKIKEKPHRDFLQSFYHLDRKSGKYSLPGNADKASIEKTKDILFQAGLLKITGFEIELSKAVFSSLGIEPQYKMYPWARCIEMMKSGSADAILTIFKNSQRAKYLYYPSEFTVDEPNTLFKLKESNITFDGDLKKLKKYVIGVITSTSYGENFDRASYLSKEEVPSTESVISLVEKKRVNLGAGTLSLLKYLMKQKGIAGKFTLLKPNLSHDHLYIAFSKARKQKQLSVEFSEKLSRFKKTDKYKKILKKYGITVS